MDVLNAERVPIGDRVYRLIPIRDSLRQIEEDVKPIRTLIEDEEDYDPDLPIMHQGNKFHIAFHVPKELIPHVIGKQYRTLQLLQQGGAKVKVERLEGLISITGATKMIVGITYHRVMERINMGRLKNESTHFVSLPMNSKEIQDSFLKFKEEILKHKDRGIEESIFQNPKRLHITIAPLVLLDEKDNQNAIVILKKSVENILKNFSEKKLVVQVKGIEYMNDDPSEVDVLYAKVQELEDDNRLQLIADKIMNAFCDANLSRRQYENVKLHVTLMNTLFREKLEVTDNRSKRETFDARGIFKKYKDYDFGQIVVSEIHISIRYTTDEDGYYKSIKKIKLDA